MYTLKDKIGTTILAAGAIGWGTYGVYKYEEEIFHDENLTWSKALIKGVLAGFGIAGCATGAAALCVAAIQMWRQ